MGRLRVAVLGAGISGLFLHPLSIVDADVAMQERIERIFGELPATPRAPAGPTRRVLLEAMQTAVATG